MLFCPFPPHTSCSTWEGNPRALTSSRSNVPNDILSRLGTTKEKRDGVVMISFSPDLVGAQGEATVEKVADHVETIARVAGKMQCVSM